MPLDFNSKTRSFESIEFGVSEDGTLLVTFFGEHPDVSDMTDDEAWAIVKRMLLGEMQSDDEADLEDFMEDWTGPLCLRSDLEEALGVHGRRLGHILAEANAVSIPKKRVNLDRTGSAKTGVVLLHPS